MNEDVSIRQACVGDAPGVTALLRLLSCDVDTDSVRSRLERLTGSPADLILLAEFADHPVGLVGIHLAPLLHRDLSARITALIVRPEHRHRGIGGALLVAAESWAVSRGCTQIELNSGDHHEPAHAFYRHFGYRSDDRRFVKEDSALLDPSIDEREATGRQVEVFPTEPERDGPTPDST
jgi:GNAT superfamily N-acetyltransferase